MSEIPRASSHCWAATVVSRPSTGAPPPFPPRPPFPGPSPAAEVLEASHRSFHDGRDFRVHDLGESERRAPRDPQPLQTPPERLDVVHAGGRKRRLVALFGAGEK